MEGQIIYKCVDIQVAGTAPGPDGAPADSANTTVEGAGTGSITSEGELFVVEAQQMVSEVMKGEEGEGVMRLLNQVTLWETPQSLVAMRFPLSVPQGQSVSIARSGGQGLP